MDLMTVRSCRKKMREILYDEIILYAEDYCIAAASVEEIECVNILQATFSCMQWQLKDLA
jgi:ribonuclease HII